MNETERTDLIRSELETVVRELDLLDEYGCLMTIDMGNLRHICRYFYNLGKLESEQ